MFQHACPLNAVYMQFVVFVLGFAVLLQMPYGPTEDLLC